MADQKLTPTPTPEQAQPAITRPPISPNNPFDTAAQRIVREANAGADRRAAAPKREPEPVVNPDVPPDAGRYGFAVTK